MISEDPVGLGDETFPPTPSFGLPYVPCGGHVFLHKWLNNSP